MQQEMMETTAEMKNNAGESIQDVQNAAKQELRLTVEKDLIE